MIRWLFQGLNSATHHSPVVTIIPDGARDGDGNPETGFARGFGDVDEDAVLDRLGAGVDGDDGIECGGVAGFGHGRVPRGKEREGIAAACQSRPRD